MPNSQPGPTASPRVGSGQMGDEWPGVVLLGVASPEQQQQSGCFCKAPDGGSSATHPQTVSTSGALARRSMMRRQLASTALNLRPSLGICCMMSSLPKIGSR